MTLKALKQGESGWLPSFKKRLKRLQESHIQRHMSTSKKKYQIRINDTKLFRSLKEARAKVEGNFREQYGLVWDYVVELQRSNPVQQLKLMSHWYSKVLHNLRDIMCVWKLVREGS